MPLALLTLTTVHSTGMAAGMAAGMTGVRVVVVVLEAPPPGKPSHHPTVQIPSACATSLSLRLLSDVISDKPCADLQALVVVHRLRSRQGSTGGHKCPWAPSVP